MAMVAGVVIGATSAYFTDTQTSDNNTFTAGTLTISIDQSMQTISPVISDWAPGESTTVRFDVHNTGSLPVYLRAFANGTWDDSNLEDTMVKVTKVEYYDNGDWQTIKEDNTGISGLVYYSQNGEDASLYTLNSGATEQFRLTLLFDANADNSYQDKTYTATITAQARQTTANATWPQ